MDGFVEPLEVPLTECLVAFRSIVAEGIVIVSVLV